ncbi:MAG: Hsp33 family molecular chaperone [Rhizobiaceae bacterium]|nr:Hsp33 family molecular chaperone [Rhizobiaceae bacterium]MCV0405902.1 Hsp33 family molecular chaperone [Rhizobiaceae bacterium]
MRRRRSWPGALPERTEMADREAGPAGLTPAGDDNVVPFQVDALDVRGRSVQLGSLLDQILNRHDYPDPVARLLAEAIVLTVLLGTSLKFDGKFILQAQSDGPVDMLVADFSTPGQVRGYARFDDTLVAESIESGATRPADMLGAGVLALTIDQGAHMQRYQGVVELDRNSLEDAARVYFRQSEQIPTEIRLAVARQFVPGKGETWRAGGVIAQFLPDASERMRLPDLPGGDAPGSTDDDEGFEDPTDNAWLEAQALIATIEDSELVDPTVGVEGLLYRLFHEKGVRVYPAVSLVDQCTCSRERVMSILEGFSAEEVEESIEDGRIRVQCEFCSKAYEFDPAEIAPRDD